MGLNGLVDTSAERYLPTGLRLRPACDSLVCFLTVVEDDSGRCEDAADEGREEETLVACVGMLAVYERRDDEDAFRPCRDGANAIPHFVFERDEISRIKQKTWCPYNFVALQLLLSKAPVVG
jgi:hypothetical protein